MGMIVWLCGLKHAHTHTNSFDRKKRTSHMHKPAAYMCDVVSLTHMYIRIYRYSLVYMKSKPPFIDIHWLHRPAQFWGLQIFINLTFNNIPVNYFQWNFFEIRFSQIQNGQKTFRLLMSDWIVYENTPIYSLNLFYMVAVCWHFCLPDRLEGS